MTIEDAAELRLQQPHVVRLESRPAGVEGRGEVTIRDLLRNALRMRPDRIVIGEVRGAEALDLLTALNTGHDGALSTVHANSPADALAPAGDAGADGGAGASRTGRSPSRSAAASTSSSTSSAVADGSRRVTEIADVAAAMNGAGGAAAAPGRRRRRRPGGARGPRSRAGDPGGRRAGCGWRWSRCAGRARRATPLRPWSAAGSPRSAPARRCSAAGSSPGPRLAVPLAVAGPGAGRLGGVEPPPPLPRGGRARPARGRRGDRRLACAPDARCAPRCRPRRPRSTARRRSSWPASGPSSSWGRRPSRRSRAGGGGCARPGSTPSPPRCSASGGPAATWPGCCAASPTAPPSATVSPTTPVGNRPGALHRPARGRDAERRRALRRADPAGLPRQGARRAGVGGACWRSPPRCRSPASSRSGALAQVVE